VPVAAWLLTLADHPGLNRIVVLNSVGDAAQGCHARSGLVMEMPRFHDTLRNARTNAARMTAVPQSGRDYSLRLAIEHDGDDALGDGRIGWIRRMHRYARIKPQSPISLFLLKVLRTRNRASWFRTSEATLWAAQ
jgi:hypothetical protein